jgi:hypothetical protein
MPAILPSKWKSTMPNANTLRTPLHTLLHLAVLACLLLNPARVQASGNNEDIPDFGEFSRSVMNHEPGIARGVYVPRTLAFPIIQQPTGEAGYVSPTDGEITQFGMASQFGNVGLLAHNNLSGRSFSELAIGQEVRLVYGDGKVEYFVITQILKFQAYEPTNPYSSFRDLSNDEKLTAEQLFNKVYRGERHLIFQTCIAGPGSLSWGRLFVIATPKPKYSEPYRFSWQLLR